MFKNYTTVNRLPTAKWRPGKTGPSEGLASLLWVRAAVTGCREAKFHGVVTGPICKYSIQAAGFDFPGHTEYMAFLAARKEVAMMLIGEAPCEAKMAKKGGALRVVLVTRHLPLAKVASALTREKIFEAAELANAGLKWMGRGQKNRSASARSIPMPAITASWGTKKYQSLRRLSGRCAKKE